MFSELKAKEGKSNVTAKVKDDKTQETTPEELTSSKTEPVVLPATNIAEFDGRPLLKDLDEVDVAVMNGNVDKADLDLTDEDLVKILGFEIDEEEGVEVREACCVLHMCICMWLDCSVYCNVLYMCVCGWTVVYTVMYCICVYVVGL